jgi:hypothetical protein
MNIRYFQFIFVLCYLGYEINNYIFEKRHIFMRYKILFYCFIKKFFLSVDIINHRTCSYSI